MRVELEILRHALAIDKNVEYKKPTHKKEKKKKKEKPVEDAFEGKTLEECYKELLEIGVSKICFSLLFTFFQQFYRLNFQTDHSKIHKKISR